MAEREDGLGLLGARVPEMLRASAAYHVPQPKRVIAKLDANELAYPLPSELRERLGVVLSGVALERYPDPTARTLRARLASDLGVGGDQLVFGNGSDELIATLCSAFPGPVLYPVPTFVYYRLAAIARGLASIEVPLTTTFELDEPAVIAAIEHHHPSIVFLALPNNPTGRLWRMSFALELAQRFRDVAIISDEAYFAYSGTTNLPELAAHPNLVIMRTLSKIGMAGLRVGFTISSPAVAHVLEKVRPPYNLSSLGQRAAEFLLEEAGDWCAARATEIVAERSRLAAALTARGIEVVPSDANFLLVRMPNAHAIWQRLADAGVVVRDFDRPGPLAGCLRITIGTPAENSELLARLGP